MGRSPYLHRRMELLTCLWIRESRLISTGTMIKKSTADSRRLREKFSDAREASFLLSYFFAILKYYFGESREISYIFTGFSFCISPLFLHDFRWTYNWDSRGVKHWGLYWGRSSRQKVMHGGQAVWSPRRDRGYLSWSWQSVSRKESAKRSCWDFCIFNFYLILGS